MLNALLASVLFWMGAPGQGQTLERTCFQTGRSFQDRLNVGADVAIVYGIDKNMPARVESWRRRGYRVHLMTGVSWGEYQDYLYGRFDGRNHEDEAQVDREGHRISHGGDVYYMSPGATYGKFLCVGVQRALDAGVEAVHLEEPEYWNYGGYGESFKRDWQTHYGEPWQPQHSSPDARWRSSKLKYFLYRRALQKVFDYVHEFNKRRGKSVRCYVPTHSLLNYAQWGIVSPESSLARLNGCDGYIAQVWTGTARTPNVYQGVRKERTFETAFLEYGAMQNLVRSTGRRVWYLADPVEDDPKHDWGDYRRNWESTLTASLLHPEVWRFEVMPWPERIFGDSYPAEGNPAKKVPIPTDYQTEIQTVIHALKDMDHSPVDWHGAEQGVGVVISDSLMFQRGEPDGSDANLGHFYGLAMPLVKRGIPVEPVQLESLPLRGYLERYKLLLLSYRGQKPLSADVHVPLAAWVKAGGALVFVDDDADPYNHVREWWNDNGASQSIPREQLFGLLGIPSTPGVHKVGRGSVLFIRKDPSAIAADPGGASALMDDISRQAWPEGAQARNAFMLRRGPYTVVAGLDEAFSREAPALQGEYVDLFDPLLAVQETIQPRPGDRKLLLRVDGLKGDKYAYLAGPSLKGETGAKTSWRARIEGIEGSTGQLLIYAPLAPKLITLDGKPTADTAYDATRHLVWIKVALSGEQREIRIQA